MNALVVALIVVGLGTVGLVAAFRRRRLRRIEALISELDRLTPQGPWPGLTLLLRQLFLSEWVQLYRQVAGSRRAQHARALEGWIGAAFDRLGSLPAEGEATEAVLAPLGEAVRLFAQVSVDPNAAVAALLEQVKAERPPHAQLEAWSAVDTAVFYGCTVEGVKLGSTLVLAVHGALTRTGDEALTEDPYTVTSMVETMVSSEDPAVVPAAKRLAADVVARLRKLAPSAGEGDAELLSGAADDLQELVDEAQSR